MAALSCLNCFWNAVGLLNNVYITSMLLLLYLGSSQNIHVRHQTELLLCGEGGVSYLIQH